MDYRLNLMCFLAAGLLALVAAIDSRSVQISHSNVNEKPEWERLKDWKGKDAIPKNALGVVFSSQPNKYSKYVKIQ